MESFFDEYMACVVAHKRSCGSLSCTENEGEPVFGEQVKAPRWLAYKHSKRERLTSVLVLPNVMVNWLFQGVDMEDRLLWFS